MSSENFNHLILLIGTNPLPNFVVADYFLQTNPNIQTISLIHSEPNTLQAGTNAQAENLEKLLRERWEDEHRSLQFPLSKIPLSDVSHAKTIQHDIRELMMENLENADGIHLNYTGGTKSMSTHLYWILKSTESLKQKSSFSYLDARNFRLVDDDKDELIADDLRENIDLTFEELIALHGFERIKKPGTADFSEAVKTFRELIENEQLHLFYEECGYDRNLFTNKKGEFAESKGQLDREKIDAFDPNDVFKSVIRKMPEEYRLFNEKGSFNWELSKKQFKKYFKKSVRFLGGIWFEEYVESMVENGLKNKPLKIETNWVIKKPDWPAKADFELDVLLLHGYHFTGISCTTDGEKPLCKSKGFEIIHRTRQIGGDEAKAVLITFLDDSAKDLLQWELVYETGGRENILILGKEDLKAHRLVSEIEKFVFGE